MAAERITAKIATAVEEDSQMLDLSWGVGNDKIDDAALNTLIEALPKNPTITQVWLNNHAITDAGASALAAALVPTQVTKLWINGNKFGDDGLRSLADMVVATARAAAAAEEEGGRKEPLDELWCLVGQFGEDGFSYFAEKLPEMKLETLWLWGHKVGDRGLSTLASTLPSSETLFEIGLGGNFATDESMSALFECLPRTRLIELYARWRADCDASMGALAEALPDAALEKLSLDNSSISDRGLAALTEACEECSVERLWINGGTREI
jgi:hypothetical protein